MENSNFFEQLENKGNTTNNGMNDVMEDKKNIYQVVSIMLMILGVISSIVLGAATENTLTGFIGIGLSLISGLFMYGFGEIIRQLKLANKNILNLKDKK